MIDPQTKPDLHQMINAGRRQRSLAIWRMIDAVRAAPAHLLRRRENGAAPECDPFKKDPCVA